MNELNPKDNNINSILRELSDIKSNLAVNNEQTLNIKESISEIKLDIKEMKKNYVTQDQHVELLESKNDHEVRIRDAEKNINSLMTWGSDFVVLIGILEFIIQTFYHK